MTEAEEVLDMREGREYKEEAARLIDADNLEETYASFEEAGFIHTRQLKGCEAESAATGLGIAIFVSLFPLIPHSIVRNCMMSDLAMKFGIDISSGNKQDE